MCTYTRLDFTRTLEIMLDCTQAHLTTVPASQRRGIEDIIFCLNTTAQSIENYHLAEILNGHPPARPPAPSQPEQPEHPEQPATLTPSQARVLDYLRAHPESTQSQIGDALGVKTPTVSAHLVAIRAAGHQLKSWGRPARYTFQEA